MYTPITDFEEFQLKIVPNCLFKDDNGDDCLDGFDALRHAWKYLDLAQQEIVRQGEEIELLREWMLLKNNLDSRNFLEGSDWDGIANATNRLTELESQLQLLNNKKGNG